MLVCRCEIILAVRVTVQHMNCKSFHLHLVNWIQTKIIKKHCCMILIALHRQKTHSCLLYRERKSVFSTRGNENPIWGIIHTVTFTLSVFATSRRNVQKDRLFFFFNKEKPVSRKRFSKYSSKHAEINIHTSLWNRQHIKSLPFCLALAITSMCFIAALSIFFVTTVGIST